MTMTHGPELMPRLWVNILKGYKEIKATEDIKAGIPRQHLSFLIEIYLKKAIQPILIKEGELYHTADVPHILFKTAGILTISFA